MSGIINTKGTNAYLTIADNTPIEVAPTAITKADPPVVTVADTAGITAGDLVEFGVVGFPELDNKLLVVGTVTATDFTVVGADTTTSSGTLNASPTADIYVAADQAKLCLSQMEFGADSVNQIDVGTFCDPSAQIPGKATPGTVTFSGFLDTDDAGLEEVQRASDDQQPRYFEVVIPGTGNGYLVGKLSLAGFSITVPLEGAYGWTVSGTQTSKIRWVHS